MSGKKRYGKYWSEEELQTLKKKYGTMTMKELAGELRRTTLAVRTKARQLGLHVEES